MTAELIYCGFVEPESEHVWIVKPRDGNNMVDRAYVLNTSSNERVSGDIYLVQCPGLTTIKDHLEDPGLIYGRGFESVLIRSGCGRQWSVSEELQSLFRDIPMRLGVGRALSS